MYRATSRSKIAGTGPLEAELRARAAGEPSHRSSSAQSTTLGSPICTPTRCAVPYVPLDEDLGLVALEAMGCATPVVTCRDSGGPCELVLDERTGLVVAPETHDLAAALTRLAERPQLARELGENGRQRARRYTPERVVEALLGRDVGPRPAADPDDRGSSRPRRSPCIPRPVVANCAASTC